MGRVLRAVFVLGTASLLASCWAGVADDSARSDTAVQSSPTTPGPTYPEGVVTSDRAKYAIRGIYPSSGESCCWTSGEAQFYVHATPRAKKLQFTLYEPPLRAFAKSPPSLVVLDANGKMTGSRRILPGLQSFALALPAGEAKAGIALVHLRFTKTFVPRDEGMNADPRHLGVIIRAVAAT